MAADNANPIFPLAETNVVNTGVPVYKKLPEGITEIANSVPRQAQGSGGRRFTLCTHCKGWVAGTPVLQTKATPFVAGVQASNIYRCRRCGFPLDTGPAGGVEKKNASGIGTEGTLRP
jgi:hypothetical protein